MPWNTLATTDVTAEILPDEVAALNTVQGSTSILAGILANVIAEVQSSILVGGNQIGQSGTVPDQIREDVIAMVRWRWFASLPKTDLQSDFRRQQYDEAVKRMGSIRKGSEKVEIPLEPQNVSGPSFRVEKIRRGHRLDTHSFDTLGET
ncbi:MAG TPA: hypothetical protein VMR33_04705 [Candidatus Baltobacteraceae bacterium]|jgi:hypothetical protein|nr:hypothetical protein [Candidatus Baltobacteraceae bacterium]